MRFLQGCLLFSEHGAWHTHSQRRRNGSAGKACWCLADVHETMFCNSYFRSFLSYKTAPVNFLYISAPYLSASGNPAGFSWAWDMRLYRHQHHISPNTSSATSTGGIITTATTAPFYSPTARRRNSIASSLARSTTNSSSSSSRRRRRHSTRHAGEAGGFNWQICLSPVYNTMTIGEIAVEGATGTLCKTPCLDILPTSYNTHSKPWQETD